MDGIAPASKAETAFTPGPNGYADELTATELFHVVLVLRQRRGDRTCQRAASKLVSRARERGWSLPGELDNEGETQP